MRLTFGLIAFISFAFAVYAMDAHSRMAINAHFTNEYNRPTQVMFNMIQRRIASKEWNELEKEITKICKEWQGIEIRETTPLKISKSLGYPEYSNIYKEL
jgi:hypothetical protein